MPKKNKVHIKDSELSTSFASTGFNLPRSESELIYFEKFYKEFQHKLVGNELDPNKIWGMEKPEVIPIQLPKLDNEVISSWKMAARNKRNLSEEITAKMKLNQDNICKDAK